MVSNLSTPLARSLAHPTWKGEFPVLDAEWVPFERTQCLVAALENGILVVYNIVSNTRVPLFVPFDIKTFSKPPVRSTGPSGGKTLGDSAQPRPGQTVASTLRYGSVNTVAVAAQKPRQVLATDHSMVVAWNYQDHIATCCLDAGRREPVPSGLTKIAPIPTGLVPDRIHLKFSPYFLTPSGGSQASPPRRLLACVVSESETASSHLLISVQDAQSCSGSASAPHPSFVQVVQPWMLVHGEVVHVQWISPSGSTAEPTDASSVHPHQPSLLLGTSDGRIIILHVTLPTLVTQPAPAAASPSNNAITGQKVGAHVTHETVFVSSAAVSHLDVQLFSSNYKAQQAASQVPHTADLAVKCEYVLYFVALGNIIHNATISISWAHLFGDSSVAASTVAAVGQKRPREEGEVGSSSQQPVAASTNAPSNRSAAVQAVYVTPLTSACTDDSVVYGIQSALIGSSFVLYCFVSSSVVALDGGSLSTLFVAPFARPRLASNSASVNTPAADSSALFSSTAQHPIRLVPRDKPPFLGVVDGERFVLLRDGSSGGAGTAEVGGRK